MNTTQAYRADHSIGWQLGNIAAVVAGLLIATPFVLIAAAPFLSSW